MRWQGGGGVVTLWWGEWRGQWGDITYNHYGLGSSRVSGVVGCLRPMRLRGEGGFVAGLSELLVGDASMLVADGRRLRILAVPPAVGKVAESGRVGGWKS